jgi:hypothetical protein
MAFDYRDIMKHQWDRLEAERAAANADLEAARVNEDSYGVNSAADRILDLDGKRDKLLQRANDYVARQQPPAPSFGSDDISAKDTDLARRYGLSAKEIGVAKGWTSDPNMSDEARVKGYVEQRQRYRQMRQTGEYRDDQGRVTR